MIEPSFEFMTDGERAAWLAGVRDTVDIVLASMAAWKNPPPTIVRWLDAMRELREAAVL